MAGPAGWCCFFRCFAGKLQVCPSTAGGEKMPSDLHTALSMVQAGWALHPLGIQSVARQVPAGLPCPPKILLALPHTVVPVMSAGKEPGAGWFCSPAPSLLLGVELIGYHCQTIYIIPSKPRNQGAADTCFSRSCPTEPRCHAVPQGPPSEVCCPELQTSELARGLCCLSWPVPGTGWRKGQSWGCGGAELPSRGLGQCGHCTGQDSRALAVVEDFRHFP